jgi:APA family basic amino acid/polyamine antiporter
LASRFRESGGEYLFLSRTVHPAAGFMAGCVSLLAGFTGAIAFAATALESYWIVPGHELEGALPSGSLAMGAVLLAAALHIFHVQLGAWFQNSLVILKVVVLLCLLGLALVKFPTGWAGWAELPAADPVPFSLFTFAMSLMWISLSYSGFNAAIYVAEEVQQTEKTIPQALLFGTGLVCLLYLALNAVFLWGPPQAAIADQAEVATIAAQALGGAWFAQLTRLVIVLSLFTSISAMTMLGPRVYAKMAADGLLPGWFLAHGQIPRAAIGFQTCFALVVIRLGSLQTLLSYLGFTLSVSAALTVATIFLISQREGAAALPVPAYPFPPLFFVCCTLLIATMAAVRNPWECVTGLGTLLVGLLIYWRVRTA